MYNLNILQHLSIVNLLAKALNVGHKKYKHEFTNNSRMKEKKHVWVLVGLKIPEYVYRTMMKRFTTVYLLKYLNFKIKPIQQMVRE